MTTSVPPKRLMSLAYSASLIVICAYTAWLYAMGSYRELLVPLFMTTLILASLMMHLGQGVKSCLPRLLLLGSLFLVAMHGVLTHANLPLYWLGLPLAAAFILLPLWGALATNLVAMAVIIWQLPTLNEEFALGFAALTLLLALPPWEHARRKALLRATDPHDNDCDAYHIDTLKERLKNEFQRADMLNKRLAVLVLHLPQLDMAEEQFGQRAKTALLGALCSEVNSRCRDHDILGRAGSATFWLVLPDTSESGALLVKERLQRALSRRVLVETGQLEARLATCLPMRKESFERYLQRLEARAESITHL
ncbi:diguanylate cyclase domain-containing protein [Vreelandella stevensii]|uniref:diguanylate cyclase domain-containing protein n=1 Tax=Vreelandella stevensii TaxID=502821 RepID=UPI000366B45E|nr:diguanylate cyclase [Halomonas stevensii]